MMTQAQIANQRKYLVMNGTFPHVCSIQKDTKSKTATGGVLQTWADITGLTNIPCLIRDVKYSRRDITAGAASSIVVMLGTRIMVAATSDEIKVGKRVSINSSAYIITDVAVSRDSVYTDVGVEKWQQ